MGKTNELDIKRIDLTLAHALTSTKGFKPKRLLTSGGERAG